MTASASGTKLASGTKVAGVLGGMGPQATLDFLGKVLRASGANKDQDHIRILVDINPQIPDRNVAIAAGTRAPGDVLARMAVGLERAGADFLVMPCNTAHAFQREIEGATRLPFLSIVDETVKAVRGMGPATVRRAGLLATSGCLAAGVYDEAFRRAGIDPVVLRDAELDRFMTFIYRIKAGDCSAEVRSGMLDLAASLQRRGADVIVSACTEVPLALDLSGTALALIDSTAVLAERTVAYARGA